MLFKEQKPLLFSLRTKKIFIDGDSQIVGHAGDKFQAVPLHPEATKWLYDDFDTLDCRISDHLKFDSEEEKQN